MIEVNLQPATSWAALHAHTTTLYEEARQTRLGTEKFLLDGRHTGTGGGNHIVVGGATAADSPLLRRPDLLRSLIAYWHNHPSLSYLFSGMFIGPTSQHPRVDEARGDQVHELEIAMAQIDHASDGPPPYTGASSKYGRNSRIASWLFLRMKICPPRPTMAWSAAPCP